MSPSRVSRFFQTRKALTISLLLFGVLLLTFLETYLQGLEFSSRFITNNIIVFALVNINIILLMVLLILVLRNVVKLYFERRQRILGSQFKTKLFVAFTALSIIPAGILFVVALALINKSIHTWFDTKVEEVLRGTTEVSRKHYQYIAQNNLLFGRAVSGEITRRRLLDANSLDKLSMLISTRQKEYGVGLVEVLDADLQEVISVGNPSMPLSDSTKYPSQSLREALQGQEGTAIDAAGRAEVIRSLVPIISWKDPLQTSGVLVINTYIPSSLARQVRNITTTYESYRQLKLLKNPIRMSYQIFFGMITLLILFLATWFAFYLARHITVPIQKLAEGTHRISGGDLDFRIDMETEDELGMLIRSFNQMTDDLRANKSKLESAYGHLERTNLQLEERRLYIETVLDNIATGIISTDRRGQITTINKAAQSMLSIGPPAAGSSFRDLLQGAPLREIAAFMEDLGSPGVNWLERKLDVSLDGNALNLVLIGSNLSDEQGGYNGSVIVLENLTEQINAQRIAAWREVARRIAHEIKNPLTPIKLSAQRLRKKFFQKSPDFEGVFDEGTQMIITQVEEMRKLVDEFSMFARMPSTKPVPTDINEVLENTLRLYRETVKEVTIKNALHPAPLLALVDPAQLKRAFVNLIENAIEATERKGTLWVETTFDRSSRSIKIIFRDDGRGIPPDMRDKLFLPYFSTKREGTGLGLSIVNTIVSDHGGYIRVKKNSPRGAVFIIELPALKPDSIHTQR